jgi:peptide/nickel transport system ATP-binding protein
MQHQDASDKTKILEVNNLCISAQDRKGRLTSIVENISFSVDAGKVIALIGESGSGKTTISLACMGYTKPGCKITSGSIRLDGIELLDTTFDARREIRGKDVSYIAQSAAAAFNGTLTLNRQVTETPIIKGLLSKKEAINKAVSLYRELDLPDPDEIGGRYPHQVSGGQLQRLMAAMAMICDPKLLILDEPTTALDVTTQIEVLRAFKKLIRKNQTSAIYVSHDLAVVAQIADHILVLKDGKMVEMAAVETILHDSEQAYTQELIGAAHVMPKTLPEPRPLAESELSNIKPLLNVSNIVAGYGRTHKILALNDVSLEAFESRTIGVIGESGSGKTTLGRIITGLMPAKSGHVDLLGQTLDDNLDNRSREQLRSIQFAFQMADVALNPRHKIGKILGRPLAFYFGMDRNAIDTRVSELLELVELPASYASRYPRELSGGERQRVNLARALAAEPKLIICDEITSALDTVVARAILRLLADLQARLKVGYLFITHDISTLTKIADTIAVMRYGEVVAYGTTQEILTPPHHPYTELLLNSVPDLRTDWLDNLPTGRGTGNN